MALATGSLGAPFTLSTQTDGVVPGTSVIPQVYFVPLASGQTVYQGSLVVLNPSGLAQPAGSATGTVLGRCEPGLGGQSANTGAGAINYYTGANGITVRSGAFLWNIDAAVTINQANFGSLVYAYNDHTITSTATSNSIAGVFVGLDTATQSLACVLTTPFTNLL